MIMDTLSKYNLCKPVIAKYLNGVCFGYAQGVTSNGPLMLTNDYLNKIALKLAEFHLVKIELPSCDIDTHFELMAKYSSPSEKGFSDMFQAEIDKIKEFPFNDYPKFSEIKQIEEDLILKLEKIGYGETGLCHNDLNQKNIIWDPQERDLSLIDFEQTMNNYVGYDIGYFYVSITGHFLGDVDEDLFPKNNYRLKLVRRYLEEKYKLKNEKPDNESFEEEVKKLNIRSNLYALSFMIRLLSLSLFFAFKPELFRKTDFSGDKLQNSINCGLYGYKIIKLFHKTKFDLLKPYESYFNDEKN